jgi:hypothetical protein
MLGLLLLAHGALAQLVSGPTEVCRNTPETYFYNGSCPFGSWQLPSGGTVVAQSATSVTVQWSTTGNKQVRYQGAERGEGCLATLNVLVIQQPVEIYPDNFDVANRKWRFAPVESNATCFYWVITVTGGTYTVLSENPTTGVIEVQFSPSATQARICVYTCPIDCQTGDRVNNFCITRFF